MNDNQRLNPYAAPAELHPGKLHSSERKTLELYLRFRQRGPTMMFLLARCASSWLATLVLYAILAALLVLFVGRQHAYPCTLLLSGVLIGIVSRDIRYCRSIQRNWPLLMSVLDWNKIESLADAPPP